MKEKTSIKDEDFTEYIYIKSTQQARNKDLDEDLKQRFLGLLATYFNEKTGKQREILNIALSSCSDKNLKTESPLFELAANIISKASESNDEKLRWEIHDILLEKANSDNEDERKRFEPIFAKYYEKLLQPK
jgi:hypothetical protein